MMMSEAGRLLYTTHDLSLAKKRGDRALITLLVGALASVTFAIIPFCLKIQWLTVAVTAVLGCAVIFWWDLKGAPAFRYARFVNSLNTGLEHEFSAVIQSLPEDSFEFGGVPCRPIHLLLDIDTLTHTYEGEPVCYYSDVKAKLPALQVGMHVRVRHTGRVLKDITVIGEK